MSIDNKRIKRFIEFAAVATSAIFIGMSIFARRKKASSVYEDDIDQKNPFEGKKVILVEYENDKENADGVKGHLEAVGDSEYNPGFYERRIKRVMDVILSFGGLVVLSPVFIVIALAIKIEDPGPVLFTQKRVGQNKKYFKLHKFRSMKMDTPHDVPTHQLENPEQYITKIGKFIRAHSLDELSQIWDIFVGNMSVIGPRPGLWNQDLLIAERDKYGANDVKPGLTGWAQINGRDELEIEDKAKLDGEYCKKIGLKMDIRCFLGSFHVFGKDESVVEGGTGEVHKDSYKICRHYTDGKSDSELIGHIGFGEKVQVNREAHKRVLITGAGSYIGETFRAYAAKHYDKNFTIDAIDMQDSTWRDQDFSKYNIVYHVAGIAHADLGNVDDVTKEKYYVVNTDLAIEVAQKAKAEDVKEFIFMSSMIVYGDSADYGQKKVVDANTVPDPANFYGDSKLQADVGVRELADDKFKVVVLRPPMIYGKGSKGNYSILAKLAKKLPVFPEVDNERSMLHIDNLCEFLCQIMLVEMERDSVVLIPQNVQWTRTSSMVREIADVDGKKIRTIGILKPAVFVGGKFPGKIGVLVNKAFGNSCYAQDISMYEGVDYQVVSLSESIKRTEGYNSQETYHPLISVIMPVYNDDPSHLKLAIDSIINQTYTNFELFIVDDSTSDDSKAVIESYESDSRVKILTSQSKLGFVSSLNYGLSHAGGSLIARMDGDDISLPNRFEKQVEYLKDHPNCDILGGQIDIIDESGKLTGGRSYPLGGVKLWCFFLFRTPLAHPTVMFRRKIVDAGYRYDVSMKKAEDIDFWIRLFNEGYRIENLSDTLLQFRIDRSFMEKRVNNKDQENYVIKSRRKNFSLKRPIFSTADYMTATIRQIVPDSFKAKQYQKENGE